MKKIIDFGKAKIELKKKKGSLTINIYGDLMMDEGFIKRMEEVLREVIEKQDAVAAAQKCYYCGKPAPAWAAECLSCGCVWD